MKGSSLLHALVRPHTICLWKCLQSSTDAWRHLQRESGKIFFFSSTGIYSTKHKSLALLHPLRCLHPPLAEPMPTNFACTPKSTAVRWKRSHHTSLLASDPPLCWSTSSKNMMSLPTLNAIFVITAIITLAGGRWFGSTHDHMI